MSSTPERNDIRRMIGWALDGEANPAQLEQLRAWLRADPAARRHYVDLMLLDTLLTEELAPEGVGGMIDLLGGAGHAGQLDTSEASRLPVAPPTRQTTAQRQSSRPRRWWPTVGWAAAAVALCATFLGIGYVGLQEASAESLVKETRRVHQLPLDRCYLVEVERSREGSGDGYGDSWISARSGRVDRLWTRGDRFFLESSNNAYRWAWGRNEKGTVWLAYGRRQGLLLEVDEQPAWLTAWCDVLSMQLDSLLDDVLVNCQLTWESGDAEAGTKVVRAVRRFHRRRAGLREARLEIDQETKVLRRLTLVRWVARTRQMVTVTYTLAATEAQPDERYELSGHLEPPFTILSNTTQPERRDEILTRLFKPSSRRSSSQ
ncbi:MAG: hypothetical protein FJ276_12000 [Planctomycetes bacterium]|nr:hypothetical protein [Planctomycetota bacterium]